MERARKEVKRGPYRDLMVRLLEDPVSEDQNNRLDLDLDLNLNLNLNFM